MKTKLYLALVALFAWMLVGQSFLFAQSSNVEVTVNFDHRVNVGPGRALSPGTYTFYLEGDQTDQPVFRVQSSNGETVRLTSDAFDTRTQGVATSGDLAKTTHVQLENINGTYYLHRITLGRQNRGFEFELPTDVRDKVSDKTHVVIPASGGNAQ